MLLTIDQANREREHIALRSMFAARKRVFVDLLKWKLPVLAGRFEVDHFDDPHATYLIVTDTAGEHLASARLLPTTRPALLDSLFPYLVAGAVPQGPGISEITRFCLSRDMTARERRLARDLLLVGLVEHARSNAVDSYTGVAELSWFRQIQTFGWDCRQLGAPCEQEGRRLVGLQIHIDDTTLERLAAAGIGSESRIAPASACAA
jgi:acyl-homoserine lactone synthase